LGFILKFELSLGLNFKSRNANEWRKKRGKPATDMSGNKGGALACKSAAKIVSSVMASSGIEKAFGAGDE